MGKTIDIGGRIHNPEVGNIVTGANEILDDTKNKKQDVINSEVDAALEALNANKQDNLTFDQTPTESSTNPVTSGGVYAADQVLQQTIEAILLLIPSAASALNQLADKSFVNSSIATASATFRGTYNLVSDLHLSVSASHQDIATALASVVATADNNDYCFVQVPTSDTSSDIRVTERYKFNGTAWQYEYDLNNSGFTAQQWAAINSTITSALVGKLSALPTADELAALLAGKQATLTFDSTPTPGSANPVTSGGLYDKFEAIIAKIPSDASANNKLVAENRLAAYVGGIIGALDATFDLTSTDGHVTLRITQTDGLISSVQVLTSDIASAQALTTLSGQVSTNASDIATLQDLYNALQQSAPEIIQPTDTWPVANPSDTVIYRVIDRVNTPPEYYSDYMWNGTTMVLMATYNNAIDDEPTAGSNNLVRSGSVARIQDVTFIGNVNFVIADHNKYIHTNGDVRSGGSGNYTEPLTLKPFEAIVATCKGYSTNVAIISQVITQDTLYKPLVSSEDSAVHDFVYINTSDADMQIALSYVGDGECVAKKISLTNKVAQHFFDIFNKTNIYKYIQYENANVGHDAYIRANGTVATGVGSLASYTKPITLPKNCTIEATCKGYSTNISIISQVVIEDTQYIPLVISDGSSIKTYKYTNNSNDSIQIALSYLNDGGLICYQLFDAKNSNGLSTKFDKVLSYPLLDPIYEYGDMLSIIKEWGFIGDSLTSGQIYYLRSDNVQITKLFYRWSWGQSICDLCGTIGTNFSVGGATAKSWIQRYWTNNDSEYTYKTGGGKEVFRTNPKPVYTICLGTNDVNTIINESIDPSTYIGSWSDVDISDYENNADTFYGNYAGIIQRIKSIQPSARIFIINLCQLFHTSDIRLSINTAIANIQSHFVNSYLIDLETLCPISNEILTKYTYGGHMTVQGYQWLSYVIGNIITNVIRNNVDKFDAVPFIGTDVDNGSL